MRLSFELGVCVLSIALGAAGCDSPSRPHTEPTPTTDGGAAVPDADARSGDSGSDAGDLDDAASTADSGGCRSGPEDTPAACADGCSNDGDAYVDCDDYDCRGLAVCGSCASGSENTDAACSDGCSNDGDMYVDCDDFDCAGVSVCSTPDADLVSDRINALWLGSPAGAEPRFFVHTAFSNGIEPPVVIGTVPAGATDGCVGALCLPPGGALPDGDYALALDYRRPGGESSPAVTVQITVASGAATISRVTDRSTSGDAWEIADVRVAGAGGRLSVSWDLRAR